MKKICGVTALERFYLLPIFRSLKGSSGEIRSALKILDQLEIDEEEGKENINMEIDENSGSFKFNAEKAKEYAVDIQFEDAEYIYMKKVFEARDKAGEWEVSKVVCDLLDKFEKAEDVPKEKNE